MILNVLQYDIPLVYVNQVGAHTELIFDGNSLALNKDGSVVVENNSFLECISIVDFDSDKKEFLASSHPEQPEKSKIELIHDALVLGISDYFFYSRIPLLSPF